VSPDPVSGRRLRAIAIAMFLACGISAAVSHVELFRRDSALDLPSPKP
jgi:hypothetical protein